MATRSAARSVTRLREGDDPIEAPRPFILCADDYALSPGVSRGILEALEAGALSATSAMTTTPHWAEGAAALRRLRGHADIGLHLNLTCGSPLTAMPLVAPDGRLPSLSTLLRRLRGGADGGGIEAELRGEIDAQAAAFEDSTGGPGDHVDGHQHVHALPAVRRPLLAVLRRRGWRGWLRDSGDDPRRILRRRSAPLKALALAMLARGFGADADRAGFGRNRGFAGFSRFDPHDDYGALFARYLSAPGPRHLVMCHPGYTDEALRRLDPVVATREQELRFLLSPGFGHLLARRGLRPATFPAFAEA